MKPELIHVLRHVHSEDSMSKMISNFNANDSQTMFNLLDFTDKETERRWIELYLHMIRGY